MEHGHGHGGAGEAGDSDSDSDSDTVQGRQWSYRVGKAVRCVRNKCIARCAMILSSYGGDMRLCVSSGDVCVIHLLVTYLATGAGRRALGSCTMVSG